MKTEVEKVSKSVESLSTICWKNRYEKNGNLSLQPNDRRVPEQKSHPSVDKEYCECPVYFWISYKDNFYPDFYRS